MDKTDTPRPVVHHRPNSTKNTNKFKSVVSHFAKHQMIPAFEDQIGQKANWDEISDENLLHLRRKLVHKIKEGMLERKDLERDIANYAVMVWWVRLTNEQRSDVIGAWG